MIIASSPTPAEKGKVKRQIKATTTPKHMRTRKEDCRDYLEGKCTRGADCPHKHPATCRFFASGRCTYENCRFAHLKPDADNDNKDQEPPKEKKKKKKKKKKGGKDKVAKTASAGVAIPIFSFPFTFPLSTSDPQHYDPDSEADSESYGDDGHIESGSDCESHGTFQTTHSNPDSENYEAYGGNSIDQQPDNTALVSIPLYSTPAIG